MIAGRQNDPHPPAQNFVSWIVGVVDDCDGVDVSLQVRQSKVSFGIQPHCNCSDSIKEKNW